MFDYGNTDNLVIVTDVLQGDTLALFLTIICLDYVLWRSADLMDKTGFMLKKGKKQKKKKHPAETISDADYVDDLMLLRNAWM